MHRALDFTRCDEKGKYNVENFTRLVRLVRTHNFHPHIVGTNNPKIISRKSFHFSEEI